MIYPVAIIAPASQLDGKATAVARLQVVTQLVFLTQLAQQYYLGKMEKKSLERSIRKY